LETVLLNATVRVRDALRRFRPDRITIRHAAITLRDRSVALVHTIAVRPAAAHPPTRYGAHRSSRVEHLITRSGLALGPRADLLRTRLGSRDRLLPIGVALLILLGSLSGVAAVAPTGAVGGTTGLGDTPRLAIAGLENGASGIDPGIGVDGALAGGVGGTRSDPSGSLAQRLDGGTQQNLLGELQPEATSQPAGPYLADGTLLKPIAVTTAVADGADTLGTYRVRSGDTLTGIARHFGISMMTLWWANHLKSKDALHVGQQLVVPPVDGTVRVIKAGETLAKIAADGNIAAADIIAFNGLTETTLVVGQTLMLPGAHGAPIPTPKPVARSTGGSYGSRASVSSSASYGGGAFAWPVPGGYISQYFHYGHPAIDIAAPYGSPVLSAASGTVTFAGWRDNGGGYQVYVSHGSGLYTTYNHMSAITVGVGQQVGRRTQVGRIGMTGAATGPHCHFEVWHGFPWENGSERVNPLSYL
jgi:murein DD-endopeptidase MepM/ murein hydrolase activator NlpD